MNFTRKQKSLQRILLATVSLVAMLGLNGASCRPAMNASIDQHYAPAVIQARDAASIAAQCGTGIGTPAQVAAATAAAESAQVAANELAYLMAMLKQAYSDRLTATEMRASADTSSQNWSASIARYEELANVAVAESGKNHYLHALHGISLPADYSLGPPNDPTNYPDVYPNSWAVGSAANQAEDMVGGIQSALDECTQDSNARPGELAQLRAWLDEAKPIAAEVAATNAVAQQHPYDNSREDEAQLAVRKAYKLTELGYRAAALKMTVAARGGLDAVRREAAAQESRMIANYEALLARTGNAQRRALDAANAAYRAATNCGIDTAPIVPGSPEWNSTFWQVSSP